MPRRTGGKAGSLGPNTEATLPGSTCATWHSNDRKTGRYLSQTTSQVMHMVRQGNYADVGAMNASPTSTAKHDVINLDGPEFAGRFHGTTHMNMLGTNNIEVFDFLLNWVKENLPDQPKATGCKAQK